MQRTKKRNKAALVLPVLLVGSGILVACIGLSLKAKLKEDGATESKWQWRFPS